MIMNTAEMNQHIEQFLPFIKRLGVTVLEAAPGTVTLKLPLAGNENHLGIIYAGSLFSLAELTGGAISLSTFDVEKFYPVAKELSIRYWKPATSDVTVKVTLAPEELGRMKQEVETTGKTEFIVEPQLTAETGVVVATTKATYQIRRF